MNKFSIETERLLIQEFEKTDVDFIIELLNSKGWIEYIGNRDIRTKSDAEQYIHKLRSSYIGHGYGLWKVSLKYTNNIIGMCGLVKREYLKTPDLGFAFLPQYHNKGYAYEASINIKLYAQKHLGLQSLYAITQPNNTSCLKLLNQLNFERIYHVLLPKEDKPLYLFETNLINV